MLKTSWFKNRKNVFKEADRENSMFFLNKGKLINKKGKQKRMKGYKT